MNKNILIIGQGVVGNAQKELFKKGGFNVSCYDIREHLSDFKSYDEIFIMNKGAAKPEVRRYEIVLISVPTLTTDAGQDFAPLNEVMDELNYHKDSLNGVPIVIRCTVLPGTCDKYTKMYPKLSIVHMPEFLTEKNAVEDILYADRLVISGTYMVRSKVRDIFLDAMYEAESHIPRSVYVFDDYKVTEMIKYANNYFLACKVALANEIYDVCEKIGIDYGYIKEVISDDERIEDSHIEVTEERGFGGMCFSKDTKALSLKFPQMKILKSIIEYNEYVRSQSPYPKSLI